MKRKILGFTAQQCLVALIEQLKASSDNKNCIFSFFENLSQAFGSINHELFIAKLHVYGLDFTSLKLIHSNLKKTEIISANQ